MLRASIYFLESCTKCENHGLNITHPNQYVLGTIWLNIARFITIEKEVFPCVELLFQQLFLSNQMLHANHI